MLRKLVLIFFLLTVWMPASALAQRPKYYKNKTPVLILSPPAIGSQLEVRLRNAPPYADLYYDIYPVKPGAEISFENSYPDSKGFNKNFPRKADFQGRHVFQVPLLTFSELIGKAICVEVLINDQKRVQRCFILEPPSLRVTTDGQGNRVVISGYDEVTRTHYPEFEIEGRRPIKTLFSWNISKAYVLLSDDRILVFDTLKEEIEFNKPALASGLKDIILTPDSRRLVALTSGRGYGADLWIYDAKTMIRLDRVRLGEISDSGSNDYLAVAEDSTMVFVRQSGLVVGEYNLITGGFQRKRVGRNQHSGGEVYDIKVCGNRMAALISLQDRGSCLTVVNTQNYQESFINLDRDPREVQLCPGFHSDLYLLFAGDDSQDFLWRVNLDSLEAQRLILPNGAHSFAIKKLSDIGMILYPKDRKKSLVRFFTMGEFLLMNKEVPLELDGDIHEILLSQSPLMNSGYVSSRGVLYRIDLHNFEVSNTPLDGAPCGPIKEIY